VYTAAKFLQALGLVLLPLALWYGLTHEGEGVLTTELLVMTVGAALFFVGWRLQNRAR
jgi:hypothetical protein